MSDERLIIAGTEQYRIIGRAVHLAHSTGIYDAVKRLYNAGFRGPDLALSWNDMQFMGRARESTS